MSQVKEINFLLGKNPQAASLIRFYAAVGGRRKEEYE
jgi:hypothetical protein